MAANTFEDVVPRLSQNSLSAVQSFGFSYITPVQMATIPLFLTNKDVCVDATTGSGKTLAFGIPIFEILHRRKTPLQPHQVGALVIAPTRELANQIFAVISRLAAHFDGITCGLFVGGTDVTDSLSHFETHGAQVVVGTPGRIIDIVNSSSCLSLKALEVLVLDEADTLLDMGFRATLNQILSLLPKQRRTGLFSATQTSEVKDLARAGMRNPVTVSVKVKRIEAGSGQLQQQSTPSTLRNYYTVAAHDKRVSLLCQFLRNHANEKVIVFVATCACVDFYSLVFAKLARDTELLTHSDGSKVSHVVGLHGKMIPKKRSALYQKFVTHATGVLFSTDVAARGVDIPDVDWIVQLAAPKDPAFFVHRVGRTARAGRQGGALLFVSEDEVPYVELLHGRDVPLMEMQMNVDEKEAAELVDVMQNIAMHDREALELGSTAFMSFLRAYKEHLCSYIFRFDRLSIGDVARAYGLLKLPKIPETRNRDIDFVERSEIITGTIPYLHKEKEAARQRRLQASLEEKAAEPVIEAPKPKKVAPTTAEVPEKRKRKKKEGLHKKIMDEWDDLAAEETLYKKFKKGKISSEKYESALFDDETPVAEFLEAEEASDSDNSNSGDEMPKKKMKAKPLHKNPTHTAAKLPQKKFINKAHQRGDFRKKPNKFNRNK